MAVQSNSRVHIQRVESSRDRDAFLRVPDLVYRGDRHWVPPLRSSIAKQFSPDNPFFSYGEMQQFLALMDDRPVGRVVASINRRLIEREGVSIGLFGFFECIQDFEVAQHLLSSAGDWLGERGMTVARGPVDFSTHNNCLCLVDGYDSPPAVMMPYNPAYYPDYFERDGWHKANDAYAYDFPLDQPLSTKFAKAYYVARKSGIDFRPLRTNGKAFEDDCRSLYRLFTTAFADNWGSSPRTEAEFLAEANDLRQLVDPDLFPIAEDCGEMVGFFMGLPDYNIPLKHVNGSLNWLGMLKFLWFRRQIDRGRIIAICSLPAYRRKMVPLALIYLGMQGGTRKDKPYRSAELSWVWETNSPSRRLIEAAGGQLSKTYRIYEKAL